MFGQDRTTLRHSFFQAWRKHSNGEALEPLEALIAQVIAMHPEYHALLDADEADQLDRDYLPELGQTNPFLHMAMHIAIHEQLASDRPVGIRSAYQQQLGIHGEAHAAEHRMMECLGEALWQAQRNGQPPDEAAYLACLQQARRN